MKTKFFLLAVCFAHFTALFAQETSNEKSNVGIKGGYNLAAVNFDGDGETDQRHGFHIGLYGESFVSDNFAIQPEIMFSQQGYVINNGNEKFTQKLNYINIPLMFKAYPADNFFLEVGPQVGLAVTHKEEYSNGFLSSNNEYDPKKFDWGMNFGTGIKSNSGLSIGVRYHLGLGDLYEQSKAFNRVWQFSLGIDF
ncbi:porin family protein [Flavobacterium sp. NG2]|uniref:porin family protein n=1 Tax=Flavobacterium sp. NG2 TaxID=3097547 RepID=UPI002A8337BB|nr:porin family protein [Flavobacterium sp. NG2]WPR70824.1 porin family protein [Flavobacterium sp. NG2]